MNVEDALAIGKEDENGALIIDDTTRDPQIEAALLLLMDGVSNDEAASKVGLSCSTMLARIGRNTNYFDYYAKAKVCKGVQLIEGLLDMVEGLESMTKEEANAMRIKVDVHKFVAGKYAPHFGVAMENMQKGAQSASPINLQINVVDPGGKEVQVVSDERT